MQIITARVLAPPVRREDRRIAILTPPNNTYARTPLARLSSTTGRAPLAPFRRIRVPINYRLNPAFQTESVTFVPREGSGTRSVPS